MTTPAQPLPGHRTGNRVPETARPPVADRRKERAGVVVRIPDGDASLDALLPAVEALLLSLAATETHPRAAATRLLPAPLADRVALAALYRVWDTVDHQLRTPPVPVDLAGPREPSAREARLSASDLAILHAASAALAHPTEHLADLLSRHEHRQATRALTAVLWSLIPDPPITR